MIERPHRRDESLVTGRTAQNKLVHVPAGSGLVDGAVAEAVVSGSGRHHLSGDVVRLTGAAPPPARIPVAAG
ncbi:MAG: hypothetical protein U5R31_12135 [Acidimicrobiia bacterium]|nr:hypothetical protein [Acidimicrobiia bacterium]